VGVHKIAPGFPVLGVSCARKVPVRAFTRLLLPGVLRAFLLLPGGDGDNLHWLKWNSCWLIQSANDHSRVLGTIAPTKTGGYLQVASFMPYHSHVYSGPARYERAAEPQKTTVTCRSRVRPNLSGKQGRFFSGRSVKQRADIQVFRELNTRFRYDIAKVAGKSLPLSNSRVSSQLQLHA
jgi:hypothetical protein